MAGRNITGQEERETAVRRYAVATLAVVVAALVRAGLEPWLAGHSSVLVFTISVMLAARFGGVLAGVYATFLSALTAAYFFIPPFRSFFIKSPGDVSNVVLFLGVGAGISLFNGQLRRALRTSTEAMTRYQTLTEAVPHIVWTSTPDGGCSYLNPRWEQYTGVPAWRQLEWGWLDQVHPSDRAGVAAAWRSTTAAGADFHMEARLRRRDGVYRWFDVQAVPLRDDRGRILGWFGSNTDVHEARQATEALRLERERLERIIATAPAVICSFRLRPDGSACFPYASPSIRDLYCVEARELAKDAGPVFQGMPPEDAARVRADIAESGRTMTALRCMFRFRHPIRGEIWVEGHSQPTTLSDGSTEWYGFVSDVTERHRMEEQLREHTRRLEELARTLDLAHALVWNLDGTITYWSEGASLLYGWSGAEAVGRRSHDLLRTEFPTSIDEAQTTVLATGRWEGELRHYRRDGTLVVVASHWSLHCDESGQPRSVTEVNNDITQQKRVEAELRASEQRLELAHAAGGIATWDWDLQADVLHISGAYAPLYRLPARTSGPSSEEWLQLIHPGDQQRVAAELRRALMGIEPFDTEFRLSADGGAVRWIMGKGQVHRDASGNAVRMVGVNMDITERKAAAEQLRALSASLISAQEEERRRISRELHDDLTQRLCAMSIGLGRLAGRPVPATSEELRGLQERAVEAAELTRHIAHELHPAILDEFGIEKALRAHCEQVAEREEIAIVFSSAGLPPSLRRETASCLYAVAQESLVNVAKHAHARQVTVELTGMGQSIRLSVTDDGVGFSSGANPTLGLGIVNMRERVRSLAGRFLVESQPDGGTRIEAEVPL